MNPGPKPGTKRMRTEIEVAFRFILEPGVQPTEEEQRAMQQCLELFTRVKAQGLPHALAESSKHAAEVRPLSVRTLVDEQVKAVCMTAPTNLQAAAALGIGARALRNYRRRLGIRHLPWDGKPIAPTQP